MKRSWRRQRLLDTINVKRIARRVLPGRPGDVNEHGVIEHPDETLVLGAEEGKLRKLPSATVELTLCADGWRVGYYVSTTENGRGCGASVHGPAFATRTQAIQAVIDQCNWHPRGTASAKQAKRLIRWLQEQQVSHPPRAVI